MEAAGQDDAHVLMTVAQYDRGLPVLLLNDGGAALAGGPTDTVVDLWGLSCVLLTAGSRHRVASLRSCVTPACRAIACG